ncbi:unnamed protein product [Parajaminaea phylloscopi]
MSSQGGAAAGAAAGKTKQQTSSRMMKTTRRGRPYAKDTHDLFATLIVSLELTTHRQYFKQYHNSFTTDEAAENLSALKFSQSNRVPDPKEPSRVVTTTTTTTFSMNREMAKGICQHFMDARLIENAADPTSAVFKDKGVYKLTPKGLHMLERFIAKNGINAEHLQKVFNTQPIYMKLLHLDRRVHDDELLINRPIVEVLFRRFCGRQPNYIPGGAYSAESARGQSYDRTLGIGLSDIKSSRGPSTVKHTFSAVLALDWLCDHTTICGRDEAAEICAHFQRLGLIQLVKDTSSRREAEEDAVLVRGEDGIGRVSEGEFRCHYKAIYGLTDRGRAVARWSGYAHLVETTSAASASTRHSRDAGSSDVSHHDSLGVTTGRSRQSVEPDRARASLDSRGATASGSSDQAVGLRQSQSSQPPTSRVRAISTNDEQQEVLKNSTLKGASEGKGSSSSTGVHSSAPSTGSSSNESRNHLFRKPSAAEALRNDYMVRSSGSEPPLPSSSAYNSRDSNTNRLSQIVDEPALRSLFRDFLRQNFCEENLSFVIDVRDFKQRFSTTSSAVAVRSGQGSGGSGESSGRKGGLFNRNAARQRGERQGPGYTAMEKHQQDLIASAFKIYATYLAPTSPKELNLDHNLRAELISYMTKVIGEGKAPAAASSDSGSKAANAQDHSTSGTGADSPAASSAALPLGLAGPSANATGTMTSVGTDDSKDATVAALPRPTLHASQLQTIVRLYERISEHIWRLMATDSVPRFIKDARFLNLVKSVEEYTEALESGRLDPSVAAGPSISKHVVDAMELGAGHS